MRIIWCLIKDASKEAIVYRDYGAARTNLRAAWDIFKDRIEK